VSGLRAGSNGKPGFFAKDGFRRRVCTGFRA
jgi:hypothetical protein